LLGAASDLSEFKIPSVGRTLGRWSVRAETAEQHRELVGLVDVARFARAGSFAIIRERDEPACVHEREGQSVDAKHGDFLVRGWRGGSAQWNRYAVDSPIVIPSGEYGSRIWPAIVQMVERFGMPASLRCCYTEPRWTLRPLASRLEAYSDGTYEVSATGHGAYEGDGTRRRFAAGTSPSKIAAVILRVMGQRLRTPRR